MSGRGRVKHYHREVELFYQAAGVCVCVCVCVCVHIICSSIELTLENSNVDC